MLIPQKPRYYIYYTPLTIHMRARTYTHALSINICSICSKYIYRGQVIDFYRFFLLQNL